ncbi:MAG: PilZ domain-containing protein [Acidiferrobacterales bacterium]
MSQSESGREHERMPISVVAEVISDTSGTTRFQVTDLSKTGAFLIRENVDGDSPAVGARVRLKLVWPMDTDTPPLEVDADVMRVTDEGIGVQFNY